MSDAAFSRHDDHGASPVAAGWRGRDLRHSEISYRPEIDGLRAVAVGTVITYHVGLGGGGFIGVDVFFVISGFLITSIIAREIDSGSFSLLKFYERRARRILPALTCTIIVALIAGWFLLLPRAYAGLGASALAAAFSVSNIFFRTEIDYFNSTAELLPLLHTWSLGVEEQFYLLFPLFMMIVGRLRKSALWLVAGGSFVLSLVGVYLAPAFTFYMLPTRAWELMTGALLAVNAIPTVRNPRLRNALSALGLFLIALALFLLTDHTPFPGAAALLPCAGAAAIIYSGGDTLVGRLLSLRPVVFVGLISYSAYLWHWLFISYAKHALATTELPPFAAALCVLGTLVAAVASWRFVELPFRRRVSRESLARWIAAAALVVTVSSSAVVLAKGFGNRLTQERATYAAADISPIGRSCLYLPVTEAFQKCLIGTGKSPTLLLWGDSHAAALVPALAVITEGGGGTAVFVGHNSCPPFSGSLPPLLLTPGGRWECEAKNQAVLTRLPQSIDTVILAAFWAYYARKGIDVEERLAPVVDQLRRQGRRVVIISGLPEPGYDVPWRLARRGTAPETTRPEPLRFVKGSEMISLAEALCEGFRCAVAKDGQALFSDSNHLSEYAANMLGPYLRDRLAADQRAKLGGVDAGAERH